MASRRVLILRSPRKRASRRTPVVDPAPASAGAGVATAQLASARGQLSLLLLVVPALAMVAALFVYPLFYSLLSAFTTRNGAFSLDNFTKTFDLYGTDILFTIVIVVV